MKLSESITFEKVTGEPVRAHGLSLRPQSHVFRLQTPWGGYVHNRPAGILVDDGETVEQVAIVDVTRIAQLTLLAWAAIFTLLRWRAQLQIKANNKEK